MSRSQFPARVFAGERGSAATELALVMPVVLLLVLLVVQFGLWLHARQVAVAAAQEGLAAAQVETGTADAGFLRAEEFLAEAGGVRGAEITVLLDEGGARVEVRGTAPAVLPLSALPVSGIAEGPVERFLPRGQR